VTVNELTLDAAWIAAGCRMLWHTTVKNESS